ncbi:MAG: hypothetical protein VKK62_04395 [Synechococcaceae cyanobacterium]|nr:hypothetical protein [Synechococcaceae cyanobacterium]
MNRSSVLSLLLPLVCTASLIQPAPAAAEEESITCREGLLGTRSCESSSGTTIRSRPDLFGNTNSTVTTPEGSTIRCRTRQGLFGSSTTVCE